jgi:hypothetical protein
MWPIFSAVSSNREHGDLIVDAKSADIAGFSATMP